MRLVGGKIVRSQQQQHEASVTSTSSPKYVDHDDFFPSQGGNDGDFENDNNQKHDSLTDIKMSRVVRKQSSEQTMVATTEERGKLVIGHHFVIMSSSSNFIIKVIMPATIMMMTKGSSTNVDKGGG